MFDFINQFFENPGPRAVRAYLVNPTGSRGFPTSESNEQCLMRVGLPYLVALCQENERVELA